MKSCKVSFYQERTKKRRRRKVCIVFVSFTILFVLLLSYFFGVVNPIVLETTRASIFSLSTSAVSDAVYDVLSEEVVKYDDIVSIEKDSEGNVSLISLDTIKLNLMARRFYQVAQVYLDDMGKQGVSIPLGTFTGIAFLSGIGPNVNLKLVPIGAMTSTFESKFVSAGINQTKHSLFIRLYASVSLLLPAYSSTVDSVTEVLISENVVQGKVPQVYLGANSPLNFTPNSSI